MVLIVAVNRMSGFDQLGVEGAGLELVVENRVRSLVGVESEDCVYLVSPSLDKRDWVLALVLVVVLVTRFGLLDDLVEDRLDFLAAFCNGSHSL